MEYDPSYCPAEPNQTPADPAKAAALDECLSAKFQSLEVNGGTPQSPAHACPLPQKDATPGHFPDLGHNDVTGDLEKLPARDRDDPIEEVVLHQTEPLDPQRTIDVYKDRGEAGSSRGAHYIIGPDGETTLTAPTDKVVSHCSGHNNQSIGVELTAELSTVTPPKKASDKKGMKKLRDEIEALNLSPEFKKKLTEMKDAELWQTIRDSSPAGGSKRNIYPDISGGQKQSLWQLTQRLQDEHELQDDAFRAHAYLDERTLGEGVGAEEFMETMQTFGPRNQDLQIAIDERLSVGYPQRDLEPAQALVNENNQILKRLAEPCGDPQELESFFNDFYEHQANLDQMLKSFGELVLPAQEQ